MKKSKQTLIIFGVILLVAIGAFVLGNLANKTGDPFRNYKYEFSKITYREILTQDVEEYAIYLYENGNEECNKLVDNIRDFSKSKTYLALVNMSNEDDDIDTTELNISKLPSILIINNGKVIERYSGYKQVLTYIQTKV